MGETQLKTKQNGHLLAISSWAVYLYANVMSGCHTIF